VCNDCSLSRGLSSTGMFHGARWVLGRRMFRNRRLTGFDCAENSKKLGTLGRAPLLLSKESFLTSFQVNGHHGANFSVRSQWNLLMTICLGAWASAVGENGYFPPGNWSKNQKFLENLKSAVFISIHWFNSCNDSLFVDRTLALHKSQVHCSGVIAVMSLPAILCHVTPLPAEAGCKTCKRIVLMLAFIASQ